MLEKIKTSAEAEAKSWITDFSRSLASGDVAALGELFVADSHWRNLCGISWEIVTFSGVGRVADELCRRARDAGATGFEVDAGLLMPRRAVVAGQDVIEAIFRFTTAAGPGVGVIRLLPSPGAAPKAWTLSTVLDIDRSSAAKSGNAEPTSHNRDFAKQNWLEERQTEIAFEGREPDVLVVGGGHAGISAAVELKRLGLDTLVIDRQQRVGDNWRLRYHGLKLHNKTPVNHLRYMPFPPNWPDYIPKDK
ncbi:MAG: monooxygenase, partial [Bradyrhizobium sp.]|nr:monooxygenase [Bradyrhizobium sp.]